MNAAGALGTAISGGIVFITAVLVLAKAIFSQANAVKENTNAINELTREMASLDTRVDAHEVKLAIINDRLNRK